MPVFFYSGEGEVQSELMEMIKKEHINLILIDADDQNIEDAVKKIKADMPLKVIKIKEKSPL